LVVYAIVPEYQGRVEINTRFNWCWEEREVLPKKKGEKVDKTQRMLIQIPTQLPEGFILRGSASSVHKEYRGRKLVQLRYQDALVYRTMRIDATLEIVNAAIGNLTKDRGLGDQWRTDREPQEVLDFDYCYPILEIPQEAEVNISIKQKPLRVKVIDSWLNVSDQLSVEYGMPKGTLFRSFPVVSLQPRSDHEIRKFTEFKHSSGPE
jgi:hypothetical protein